jgi:hypothetical protein
MPENMYDPQVVVAEVSGLSQWDGTDKDGKLTGKSNVTIYLSGGLRVFAFGDSVENFPSGGSVCAFETRKAGKATVVTRWGWVDFNGEGPRKVKTFDDFLAGLTIDWRHSVSAFGGGGVTRNGE